MKILAIGAHADDVEIGCGGTLAKSIENNHDVKIVVVSDSVYNNYDGKILRTQEEVNTESYNAIKKLGINKENLLFLNFPNKDIPYDSKVVEELNKIIDEYKPELILTHWTFDTHQDHRNTALATISAARNHNNILMYEPFPPSGRSYVAYRPQVYIDISNNMDSKLESIKSHKSQLNKYGDDWIDSIKGRAKMRGFESGVKYAETFELVRYMLNI
jgi:LmbE family N-acetylglucosaminyl deacetylase